MTKKRLGEEAAEKERVANERLLKQRRDHQAYLARYREDRFLPAEAFAGEKGSELFLQNAYIPEYSASGAASYEPRAPRKLLMHRSEIGKLLGAINRKGMTIVPLSVYFNKRGIAKVELAIAEGKQQRDKRQTVKQRDWDRQKARLLRNKD